MKNSVERQDDHMATETIIIDESGTPLATNLLVVGGVAISGDTKPIEEQFAALARKHSLPKKGTKYSNEQFEALAEFLAQPGLVPIASFSLLDESDQEALREKGRKLEALLNDGTRRKTSGYLWMQQVGQTVVPALCGSVALDHGPIDFVRFEFDQFTLPAWVQDSGEAAMRKWLDVSRRVEPFLQQVEARVPDNPEYFAAVRRNLKFSPTDHEISWKAPERRGRIADAIAALVRKAKLGNPALQKIWSTIEDAHRRSDGVVPSCVGLDLTAQAKELCHRDWPQLRVAPRSARKSTFAP